MQTMVPLYGFGGVPYSAVRKAAPRNLLDNSDFRNPVNQRGVFSGTLTDWNYFIDRWRCIGDCTYELTDGGIHITGGAIAQTLAEGTKDNGKTYTFAVCLSTGTIRILTYTIPETDVSEWTIFNNKEYSDVMLEVGGASSICHVMIHKISDCTIRWAALYEGEYTAATLPEYHPKGYAAELLECQRYYYVYRQWVRACAKTNDLNTAHFNFQFPIPMRLNPALQYDIVEGTQPTLIVANAYGIESWSDAGTYTLNNISATADL